MANWATMDEEYKLMRENILKSPKEKGTSRLDKKTRALWNEFIKTKDAEKLFITTIDDDEGLAFFYNKIGDRREVHQDEMEAILDEFWELKKKEFENPNLPKKKEIIEYIKNKAAASNKNQPAVTKKNQATSKKNQPAKNKSTTKKNTHSKK